MLSQLSSHEDSDVWLAEHRLLGVKRIIKGIHRSSALHDRLLREAHLLKNLKHPYIPEIYDVEEDEQYSYIIEQYIEGQSLKSLCNTGILSEKEVIQFTIQISKIIDYLHQLPEKILYLDVKPENIIVLADKCYLVDFGSAKEDGDEDGYSFGSRKFAAPEQFEGGRTGHRTDVYALGRLLDYLMEHGNVSPKVKSELTRIVQGCCENRYWNRISSAAVLTARLEKIFKRTDDISEKKLRMAFAGASANVGTTYISLLTALYMTGQKRKCAYVEANENGIDRYFTGCERDQRSIAGLQMVGSKYWQSNKLPDTGLVMDFGVLKENMPSDFYTADVTCIIVGRMAWEMREISRARALSHACRKTLFVVNMCDGIEDYAALCLKGAGCISFPYCRDFDELNRNQVLNDRIKELLLLAEAKTDEII